MTSSAGGRPNPRPWAARPTGPDRELEDQIVAFMVNRLSRLGPKESGLYDYYEQRLALLDPWTRSERLLVHHVRNNPPASLVHVGCGIGMITAKLAALGIPAVGYEGDRRRVAAANALRDELGLAYEIRPSFFPEGLSENGGMVLFTNLSTGWSDETEAAIIETLPRFERAVIDVTRFGRVRDTPGEVAELVARFPVQGRSLAPGKAYGCLWEFQL